MIDYIFVFNNDMYLFIYKCNIKMKYFFIKRYVLGEYIVVFMYVYCLVLNNKLINKYVFFVFKKWVKIKIYISDLIMFNYVLLYILKN